MMQKMRERPSNIIPLIELQSATPEELDKIRESARQEQQKRLIYQKNINKPLSEVFGTKSSEEISE